MFKHRDQLASGRTERHSSAGPTVVVIEDDADIRTLIETILARAGMTVHTASTAGEGIALASRILPDLVTIDIGLPDADGLDVAAFFRDLTATRDIPLLMISASAHATEVERARSCGAEAYLSKPFRPRQLQEKVGALLAAADTVPPTGTIPSTIDAPQGDECLTGAGAP